MITLHVSPDARRIALAYLRVRWARHVPMYVAGLFVTSFMLSLTAFGHFEPKLFALAVCVLGLYILAVPLIASARVASRYRKVSGGRPSTVYITEYGMRDVDPLATVDMAWPMFSSVIRTAGSYILLLPSRTIGGVLPRAAFTPAEQTQFEALLATHRLIPVRKRPHSTVSPTEPAQPRVDRDEVRVGEPPEHGLTRRR